MWSPFPDGCDNGRGSERSADFAVSSDLLGVGRKSRRKELVRAVDDLFTSSVRTKRTGSRAAGTRLSRARSFRHKRPGGDLSHGE
ncbi:hypothetical protein HPB47_010760 [Ixodes persulcatus]|uniref:Uncharacterized protein n=1 Tax=Ixodes persulcatus TaxID=34615 RepID=A0AC60NY98_IXOPE|nr:hypothetical protein HPB47_010760 [Ixodes persulcatus]